MLVGPVLVSGLTKLGIRRLFCDRVSWPLNVLERFPLKVVVSKVDESFLAGNFKLCFESIRSLLGDLI